MTDLMVKLELKTPGELLDDIMRLENQLAQADALISTHANSIDSRPRSTWPKDSILKAAIARHEARCIAHR
jgi:hypothetical protein